MSAVSLVALKLSVCVIVAASSKTADILGCPSMCMQSSCVAGGLLDCGDTFEDVWDARNTDRVACQLDCLLQKPQKTVNP